MKKKQWEGNEFDYLVLTLADTADPTKALAFTRSEVIKFFTTASFMRSNTGEYEHESKRLDLIQGGLKAFKANVAAARVKLKWQGTPTRFERDFNASPEPVFREFTLERMFQLMKGKAS